MATPKLAVKNLTKVFGEQPEGALALLANNVDKDSIFEQTGHVVGVNNASLDIYEGEIFVIMGLSGSGKSTLVRMLNRLIEPTAGQVLVDGRDIARLPGDQLLDVRRGIISMVFQSFALMPHMNVLENTAFGLELAGFDLSTRQRRALDALRQVGLEANAECYPDELSGGMQQRVGLARALASDPDILLMDEAFSALDPLIRTEMQDELLKLQQQHQRTVVFISHDLDEAMRIGDRIAIMQGGEVIQVGAPDDILHNPANDYVRSFFRGVDVSQVFTAEDVAVKQQVTVIRREDGKGPRAALALLKDHDRQFGYVLDKAHHFVGVVSIDSLRQAMERNTGLDEALLESPEPLPANTLVNELITSVAEAPCGVPVVDEQGDYKGVITKATLLNTLDREENS